MKPGTTRFLDRAAQAVEAAAALHDEGALDPAAGRAYYAMLYTAKALLNERGLRLRTHAAIEAALFRQWVEPGLLDAECHRWFRDALARRGRHTDDELLSDDVERLIDQARAFLDAVRRLQARDA